MADPSSFLDCKCSIQSFLEISGLLKVKAKKAKMAEIEGYSTSVSVPCAEI